MTLQEIIASGIPKDSDAIVVLQPREEKKAAAVSTHVSGYPYRTKADLAEELGISKSTVHVRAEEMEKSGRYGAYAVIRDGNLVLINILSFLDWMKYRKQLMDRNMAKYVPRYSARNVAEQMGWDMTTIRKFSKEMAV